MENGGSTENAFLEDVFDAFDNVGVAGNADTTIDLKELLTSSLDLENYWTYDGSFTTPGCMQGVLWTVLT